MGTILINNVRGNKVTETIEFILEDCCSCGISFFIPQHLKKRLLSTHERFYCPNGHGMSYTAKTDEQLKIEQLERDLERKKSDILDVETQLLDTISEKNKLSRQLKRVHKGVCPCCNRTFKQLSLHMQNKHPTYEPNKQ